MSDDVQTGFLVLADISGFTAFVTATELEHGAQITARLLEEVMGQLTPPFEIQELEGDAVFALGPDRAVGDERVLPVLLDAFAAFKTEQKRLADDHGCACGACRGVPALDLKLVTHHGRFVRQTVGGRSRVAGPDVILVHRLLKNPVGGTAYLLLTVPALERVGTHRLLADGRRLVVRYAHFGDVPCFVADLAHELRNVNGPAIAPGALALFPA